MFSFVFSLSSEEGEAVFRFVPSVSSFHGTKHCFLFLLVLKHRVRFEPLSAPCGVDSGEVLVFYATDVSDEKRGEREAGES